MDKFRLVWVDKNGIETIEDFHSAISRSFRVEDIFDRIVSARCYLVCDDGTLPEYQYSIFNVMEEK